MKRIARIVFAISLLLSVGTTVKAQIYVGGGLGFGVSQQEQLRIYIAPEVGWNVTNHFTLGGKLSYESGVNRFGLDPYVRLNILKRESVVRIMATVEAPFNWAKDYSSYGFFFRPGLSVRVSPTVRIEGHFGYFGWGSVTNYGATTQGWAYNISTNSINLGVVIGL